VDSVGVIGLGLMGHALAGRLIAGGRRVVGFDVREECRRGFVELGGEPKVSARDVFAEARVIVLSLPNSDVVAQVVEDVGGLARGSRIIDTTTGDPDASAALGRRLAELGCEYLDATLTGSSRQAATGDLVVTAGGTAETFQAAEPLFRLFAVQWFHVGPWGSGTRTKLVVNLVLGLNRAVLAEGLAFARRSGLDPTAVLEVLRCGAAYSRVMDTKGRKMIDADFTPEARLAQHLKDVRLILDSARASGSPVPLSGVHEQLLARLVGRGFGDLDNSCVIRAFDGEADR
jgi:3-hydroxyisobutyrate dehydrogenase-like beta-hydroxyacid dehydrogenase